MSSYRSMVPGSGLRPSGAASGAQCKGILLDLDDTLIDDHGAVRAALDALLVAHRLPAAGRDAFQVEWRAIARRHLV